MIPSPLSPGSLIFILSSGKKNYYVDIEMTHLIGNIAKEATLSVIATGLKGELFVISPNGPAWIDPTGAIVLQLIDPDVE